MACFCLLGETLDTAVDGPPVGSVVVDGRNTFELALGNSCCVEVGLMESKAAAFGNDFPSDKKRKF